MGDIVLAAKVAAVLSAINVPWPTGSETGLSEISELFRGYADDLRSLLTDATKATEEGLAPPAKGAPIEFAKEYWEKVRKEYISEAAKVADEYCVAFKAAAAEMAATKSKIIAAVVAALVALGIV